MYGERRVWYCFSNYYLQAIEASVYGIYYDNGETNEVFAVMWQGIGNKNLQVSKEGLGLVI